MTQGFEGIDDAVLAALAHSKVGPPLLGLVLGSGLGSYAEGLSEASSVAYADLPHFPRASVVGHAGRLWFGRARGIPVAVLQGRVHLYEGFSPAQVVFPVRALAGLGVKAVCLTNAAGGVRAGFQPGDLMRLTDHLNLTAQNPLVGANEARRGTRFPDMTHPYDIALGQALVDSALALGLPLHAGVYAQLLGPSYETPAEITMLRTLGADAIGMSTVLETIALRHLAVRVAGVSCITNLAAGLAAGPLAHAEVAEVAGRAEGNFAKLLDGFVERAAQQVAASP